ncbi:hypothetical protein E2C01_039355 [Portunus trituberculatus]|uniref:Uncharacterized protein n=1 Tax=Portunus trituberculatus TaxID=210409 RepID=A0A5B7FKK0_PORTR|nr:hypothetical protein [Portunus trituberculatus]
MCRGERAIRCERRLAVGGQQLINELVTHGVELPASTAKKSEYVKIYEKYVAPVAQSKGDFSSDDEDLPVNDVKAQVTMDTSTMVINGLDVTSLHDDDLYARLQDLGSPVGPIVGECLHFWDWHYVDCVCVCVFT